jgi:hypothetical protein
MQHRMTDVGAGRYCSPLSPKRAASGHYLSYWSVFVVKYAFGVLIGTLMFASTPLTSWADGSSVTTQNFKITETPSQCAVDVATALTTAGFKHVTSGKAHKDGTIVLFGDKGVFQAVVFCLPGNLAVAVTGSNDKTTSSLVDKFTAAWDAQ